MNTVYIIIYPLHLFNIILESCYPAILCKPSIITKRVSFTQRGLKMIRVRDETYYEWQFCLRRTLVEYTTYLLRNLFSKPLYFYFKFPFR